MKQRVFNFGIIGGSGYALILLECLEAFIEKGECRLVAAAVLPQEQDSDFVRRARGRGTQIFDDWEVMLEAMRGKLDICIIPTGIAQHRPMATRALEAGHRVFLEKPLAGCFEDALAIATVAQQHGDGLSVGYQDIYQSYVYHIRDLMRSGRLGRIRSIRGFGLWPRNASYYARNGWAGRVRVGKDMVLDSPLNNAMAHYLNLALFLASMRDNEAAHFVSIDAELYRARDIENFDTGSVRIHTEAGFPIEFHVTHSCRDEREPRLRIEGDKGRIDWCAFNSYKVYVGDTVERFVMEDNLQMRSNMFRSLMQWVEGNPSPRCTALQALGQSLCIGMLGELGQVPLIDPQFIESSGQGRQPAIEGIDALFERCFEQGGLPSEHGAPWGLGVRTVQTPLQWAEAVEQLSSVTAPSV